MRRWFLSFGALVLMAGIVAAVAASYQERWVKERVYWLIDVRGYVLTETRERALKPNHVQGMHELSRDGRSAGRRVHDGLAGY
jgi:hypothetical protein